MPGSFGSRDRSTGVQGPSGEANFSRVRSSTSALSRCSHSAALASSVGGPLLDQLDA